MKKISYLIVFGLLVISACILHLVKKGVSLRPESLISPSMASADLQNLPPAIFSRLLPQFEESQDVVFGFLPMNPESQKFFDSLRAEYQANLHQQVTVIDLSTTAGNKAADKSLETCTKACWILTSAENANQLEPNPFIDKTLRPRNSKFITLTWMPFSLPVKVPMDCFSEKRLDFSCFRLLSIQSAQRKIKVEQRNFFLNSYNGKDYFLFVEDK
jgi:hypothetical protein